MKILVVHEVSYLNKVIYEFQILPETLSLLGHDVTVIDLDDSWADSDSAPTFDVKTKRFDRLHRVYPDSRVELRHSGVIRLPLVSRISSAVTSAVEVWRSLGASQFDVLVLYGVPSVGIQSLLAARLRGVPIVFRSIDVSHQIVPSRFLALPTKLMERIVYRGVDSVSALTPHLKAYVASYGVPESKIEVLPAGVDTGRFSDGPRNDSLLERWGIGRDDPVLLFMGTIYRFSGLDRVIRDLHGLVRSHPNVRLLIVGGGEDERRLRQLSQECGVDDRVVFTGVLSYDLLPDIIRSSTICLNPFELNNVTRDILPTKLFQYLACGKPLVATRLPGMMPFLSGEEHGVVYAELPDFVDALASLLEDPGRQGHLGRNARQAMETEYDWRRIAGKFADWLTESVRAGN